MSRLLFQSSHTLYNLILPSMEADIKLKYISVEYLDTLLERVAKICPSAGNKGRELLSIAMKDAAGDKFISYNPMPEQSHIREQNQR